MTPRLSVHPAAVIALQRAVGNRGFGQLLEVGLGNLSAGSEAVLSIVRSVLASDPGLPLEPASRRYMEGRFDHDFRHVRVHTDSLAVTSARALGARAYTVGRDVIFGAHQYAPGTPAGRHLIAHELAHVVQQSSSGGFSRVPLTLRYADAPAERDAESTSREVDGSAPAYPSRQVTPGTVQCQAEPAEVEPTATAQEEAPGILGTIGGGLMGEFNENPKFAMIGVDLAVSLVPILDQASDARDLIAHLYYLIVHRQYDRPMRWIGLIFSLIGLIPEVGSVIKSASKFIIKGVRDVVSHLGVLLGPLRRVLPDISDVGRLRRYFAQHWDQWVAFGIQAWDRALQALAATAGRSSLFFRAQLARLEAGLAHIRRIAPARLRDAYEWARRQIDDVLASVSDRLHLRTGEVPLETSLETQARLGKEAHPEWYRRPQSTTPLPETTRTERPLRSLGYDVPRARQGYFTIRRPKGMRTLSESLWDRLDELYQLFIERHHLWPKYLGGIVKQSLLPIWRSEHKELHSLLNTWKNGLLSSQLEKYKTLSPYQIMDELHEFYAEVDRVLVEKGARGGYLDAFYQAAEETLNLVVKQVKP